MLKIAIGVLVVCLLTLGVNVLSTAVLPVIPWFDTSPVGRRIGRRIRLAAGLLTRADGWIRGPNRLWSPRTQRAGTGRRWSAGETLELP